MTTHYDALVRDAKDAQALADKVNAADDWSDAAMQVNRRAWVLGIMATHSFGGVEPAWIEEHWDMRADIMKGLVGQSVFIDAVRVQFKRRDSLVLVKWRIRRMDEPKIFVLDDDTSATWSEAVMTVASFHAFLGEFYLEDSDV